MESKEQSETDYTNDMEQKNFYPFVECAQYISLLQDNINRMASNSSNCKTWLVTLIAAVCAVQVSSSDFHQYLWIAYIPTGLFFFLDCFYLGIERRFRKVEKYAVEKMISANFKAADLFKFNLPKGHKDYHNQIMLTLGGIISWSTTPFYAVVVIVIVVLQKGIVL